MIEVLFFARYREALATEQLSLEWQDNWQCVDDVRHHLVQRGEPWSILEDPTLMCALNQDMCSLDAAVRPGDNLAFFPLVTGG